MPTLTPLARAATLIAVTLLASLALSGCTDTAAEAEKAAVAAEKAAVLALAVEYSTPIDPVWSVTADLVGTPAVRSEVVVSYVRSATGLQIAAWDAASGAELWRHAAVPGVQSHAVELKATTVLVGDTLLVPYLRDEAGSHFGWQELVIADALTGVALAHDWGALWVSDRPGACSGAQGICFTGWTWAEIDADQRSFRVDVATGGLSVDTEVPAPVSGEILSDGVFVTAPDGTELLGYSADGAIAWQRPYRDYFGPNSSSDQGWAWGWGRSADIVIGHGFNRGSEDAADYLRDLTAVRTVGVRRDSGDIAWSLDGVQLGCPAAEYPFVLDEKIVPMCRINSGTLHVIDGNDDASTYDDLDVDLIGVDEKTGKTRWTVPLGADEGSLTSRNNTFFSNAAQRVLMIGTVPMIVDLTTGDSLPAPSEGVYACAVDRGTLDANTFEVERTHGGSVNPYRTGQNLFACDAQRAPVAGTFSRGSVLMAGSHADDGIYVVGGAAGLSAFQLPDDEPVEKS
ncbi:hypothetical protein E3T55_15030 [Cryobacterium frigoriphilum]|uniref:Pyrrolo-quinoline quinone n=1 Tax=Cryobacterium frigoriphilum TaxID=1259150 RepID=A0A4R8ZWL0_9MICO|nr:hypothetical protein [Cryobacterium frigoriphilum]TFD47860.1 hypothetical protein E3T55_15030 [Cryobacterium frigoriphilum]